MYESQIAPQFGHLRLSLAERSTGPGPEGCRASSLCSKSLQGSPVEPLSAHSASMGEIWSWTFRELLESPQGASSCFHGRFRRPVSFRDCDLFPTSDSSRDSYSECVDLRNEIRRPLLLNHRNLAAKHVANGNEQIRHQQVVIADLGRAGFDSSPAQAFLQELRAAQQVHVASRDRIERELETLPNLPL